MCNLHSSCSTKVYKCFESSDRVNSLYSPFADGSNNGVRESVRESRSIETPSAATDDFLDYKKVVQW